MIQTSPTIAVSGSQATIAADSAVSVSARAVCEPYARRWQRAVSGLACQLDLEGIVAKRANSPYEDNAKDPHWIKIKNPNYSQKEGRADLFKRAG